jgi:hypothetical protein
MGDFDQQMEALTDQIERQAERDAERAERKARAAQPVLSAEERERLAAVTQRRTTLELARASVVEKLKSAPEGRYREQLERSIEALDAELSQLGA